MADIRGGCHHAFIKPASLLAGFLLLQQKGELMTVITISRQLGSLGDEIAQKLCAVLNYRYFDKYLVMRAAKEAGLAEQEIVDYGEENYKVRNFLDRMLDRPQTLAQVRVWKEGVEGALNQEAVTLTEEVALELVQRAIHYAYQLGNVVIVGRGGQVILQNEPDVLHVRVEAPIETRLQRIREAWRPHETRVDLRRTAQDTIEHKDAASAEYLQHFYHVRWDDPALYHVIINTGKLDIDQAVLMIAHLARELAPQVEKVAF
jgi:CMP/dCMP kinase